MRQQSSATTLYKGHLVNRDKPLYLNHPHTNRHHTSIVHNGAAKRSLGELLF